jgi:RNA polymerase sigma-70 factor (ECF subfamily)
MSPSPRSKPTRLLHSLGEGDPHAAEQLLPLVYDELRRRAQQMMGDRAAHTLQPTALIHEAYLRLVDQEDLRSESRLHFVNIAARAMRYVLADHAKAKGADKRGGGQRPVTLDEGAVGILSESENILALEEALTRLAQVDEQLCRIVELRFFGGLEHKEVAEALGVSLRTVERGWRVARAWLANAMETEA